MVVVVVKEAMVTVEGDGNGYGSDGGGALLGHHCRQSYYMYVYVKINNNIYIIECYIK